VAGARELVVDAEEAIRAIQQKVRATLRRLGTASDVSETGSVDLSGQHEVPTRREVPVDRNIQPVVSAISSQTLMAGEPGNKVADLIRCLSGAQANDSGWPLFTGKYVEYPQFRKEWWAYRGTYHGHVRDELVGRMLKEKCLLGGVRNMMRHTVSAIKKRHSEKKALYLSNFSWWFKILPLCFELLDHLHKKTPTGTR
jgi:hypothetical protein